MSFLTRVFVKQLFKIHSCLKHQIAAVSTLPSSNNRSNNDGDKSDGNSTRWFKSTVIVMGIGTCIVSYKLLKDELQCHFPELIKVNAAAPFLEKTEKISSRRTNFNFIADVVETAAKSLVYIEIQDTRRMDYYSGKPVTVSNGSGFIVESNGLILTNAHVVVNKPRSVVSVRLTDGRIFQGVVEAIDPVSDLATVRIQCKNLPSLKLGESSSLRAGEFVIALGSPLSLSNTVTAGVVSSTQRLSEELGLRGRDIKYIQTDAAITFGNSGGPLVNLDGEAIGINSMKVTAGISFAIPIDYAKNFLKLAEAKVKGRSSTYEPPQRRYMGITMLSLTPNIIAELKQRGSQIPDNVDSGILVWKVILNSPAHISGLMVGDIILNINGKQVAQSTDIYEILSTKTKNLNMIVLRNGQTIKLTVTPDEPE